MVLYLSLNHAEMIKVEEATFQKQIQEISISNKFCLEEFASSDDEVF